MRFGRISGVLLGAVLVLVGCAPTGEQGADTSASSSSPTVDLSFTAETLNGTSFNGERLAGRPAVLWFWAPWCPTCRAQAPGVTALTERFDGQVSFVGVGGLADDADIRSYAQQVDGPTHLIDPEGTVWQHFGVTAQSTYLVLDAKGVIVAEGYLDDHVLADKVEELVG